MVNVLMSAQEINIQLTENACGRVPYVKDTLLMVVDSVKSVLT